MTLPDNSVIQSTGTVLGHGLYGDVMEVAHRGNKIYAAKKYRHIDRNTLLKIFSQKQILSNVRHANLVPYLGVGALASDHSPVVVMERMSTNLASYLEAELISLHQKFKIIHEITQGLNHLHSLKPPIVHGGLNENNVLFTDKNTAKIADYGNCFVGTPELTSAAQRIVLEYMPPEILEGNSGNEKVDIFSLGHLTIYIMNQKKPRPILGPNFRKEGTLTARSEVERRADYLDEMKHKLKGGEKHPLFRMVTESLEGEPDSRPSCQNILQRGIFESGKFGYCKYSN